MAASVVCVCVRQKVTSKLTVRVQQQLPSKFFVFYRQLISVLFVNSSVHFFPRLLFLFFSHLFHGVRSFVSQLVKRHHVACRAFSKPQFFCPGSGIGLCCAENTNDTHSCGLRAWASSVTLSGLV